MGGGAPGQVAPDGSPGGRRRGVLVIVASPVRARTWEAVTAQNTDRVTGADTLLAGGTGTSAATYRRTPGPNA